VEKTGRRLARPLTGPSERTDSGIWSDPERPLPSSSRTITRKFPEEVILPLLLKELEAGGIRKKEDITL